jgi:hypothetical protein
LKRAEADMLRIFIDKVRYPQHRQIDRTLIFFP